MSESKSVFVTVGTTQFDDLTKHVTSAPVIQALKKLKYTELTLQIGNGVEPEIIKDRNLKIEFYRFKNSIDEDIKTAGLVISHAGAGSILDVLGAGKPLLVVINKNLMDNHQIEVAKKFAEEGFLYFCTPSKIAETLDTVKFDELKSYVPGDPSIFAEYLDNIMRFTKPDPSS